MDDALGEAVRVSERVLDHQLQSLFAERSDLERLMRLGVAAVAGSLAATGLLLQADIPVAWHAVLFMGLGIIVQAYATGVAAFPAAPVEMTIGPTPHAFYEAVSDGSWTTQDLRVALLDQATLAYRHNQRGIEKASKRRQAATAALFVGVASTLLGIAFVVGGTNLV